MMPNSCWLQNLPLTMHDLNELVPVPKVKQIHLCSCSMLRRGAVFRKDFVGFWARRQHDAGRHPRHMTGVSECATKAYEALDR